LEADRWTRADPTARRTFSPLTRDRPGVLVAPTPTGPAPTVGVISSVRPASSRRDYRASVPPRR
jgi:hypothetical protein